MILAAAIHGCSRFVSVCNCDGGVGDLWSWKNEKVPSSKVRKVYNLAVICSLVVTVVNILYWELYMFWAV